MKNVFIQWQNQQSQEEKDQNAEDPKTSQIQIQADPQLSNPEQPAKNVSSKKLTLETMR